MNAGPRVVCLQHAAHESIGGIAEAFVSAGLRWEEIQLYRHIPPTPVWNNTAGLVVMGGPMNVDQADRYSFLRTDLQWIKQAIQQEVPVLGICLGAQLIAKALGARVYPNHSKEIGWHQIAFEPAAAQDFLFSGLPLQHTVFQWHGDTFDLPEQAQLLARSPLCINQAFRCGRNTYALQFHLEVSPPMVGEWLEEPGNAQELSCLPQIDPESIRDLCPQHCPALKLLADAVFSRFAQRCHERISIFSGNPINAPLQP